MPLAVNSPLPPTPSVQGAVVDVKGGLIGQAMQIRSVTLTSAQLLALKGADVLIIEAPGVGLAIDAQDVCLRLNYGSVAYTLNAGTLRLYQGPSANNLPLCPDLSAILTQTANSDNVGVVTNATGVAAQNLIENQPVYIGNTGTAQFTLGNGTLDVVVTFNTVQM